MRQQLGWRISVQFRPKHALGRAAADSGGVAIICTRPDLYCISDLDRDEKGFLAVEARALDGSFRPFVIMGAYFPPLNSVFETQLRWTSLLIDKIVNSYRHLRATYGDDIILAGDFNMRLGKFAFGKETRRYTIDPVPNPSQARTSILRRLLKAINAAPAHGRHRFSWADTTSRAISGSHLDGEAEVDYIFLSLSLPEDRYRVLPTPKWGSVAPGRCEPVPNGITHRPITIALEPRPPIAADQPAKRHRRWRIPAYNDEVAWARVTAALEEELITPAATPIYDARASAQAAAAAIVAVFSAALDRTVKNVKPIHTAGAPVRRQRLFKGRGLPPAIARLFRHKRAAARSGQAEVEVRRLQREARYAARRHRRQEQAAVMAQQTGFESERVNRPHTFWCNVNREMAPENPTASSAGAQRVPDEPGHPPAPERFRAAVEKQLGGQRPNPPAIGDQGWLAHIPVSGCDALSRHFTAEEICRAFFPVMKRLPLKTCPADNGPTDACPLCKPFCEQHDRWPGGNADGAPMWRPRGRTSKSSASDDHMEHYSWARPADHSQRLDFRLKMAQAIANVFNKMLDEGVMPTGWTEYRTIMLLKSAKPGHQQNLADPDDYRPITLSPTLTKILGVALCTRLYHWSVKNRIIGAGQVGFMPHHGSELHVWTLTNAIERRRRERQDSYVLYVDLRKAYDSVDPRALLAVLRQMGLPDKLLFLLRAWSTNRTTSVSVNGIRTEPFNVTNGVGQGDVLSPLLFNLFIESLQRYLAIELPGVRIGELTLRALLYADDIAVLCSSPDEVQSAIDAIGRWTAAWGLKMNIGKGKTEAVPYPWRRSAECPIPGLKLRASVGEEVPWAAEYRYLGCNLRWDLNMDSLEERITKGIQANTARYFDYNSLIPNAGGALAFQVLNTTVTGAANYLLSMVEPTSSFSKQLDGLLADAARRCQSVPTQAVPQDAAWLDGRLPRALGLLMRERARLYLSLQHPHDSSGIAAQLFRILRREAAAHGGAARTQNWVSRTEHWFAKLAADYGVATPVASGPSACAKAAAVYGRAIGYANWRASCSDGKQAARLPAGSQLSGGPPRQHLTSLSFALDVQPSALGRERGHTPLSCRGPMCSGNLLAVAKVRHDRTQLTRLLSSRSGRIAFLCPPIAPSRWVEEGLVRFPDPSAWQSAKRPGGCPVCHHAGIQAQLHDEHVVSHCSGPSISDCRALLIPQLPSKVAGIARLSLLACHNEKRRPWEASQPAGLEDTVLEYLRLADSVDWASPIGRFLLHRLVTAQPWPATVVPLAADPATTLARRLGELFDATNVQPRHLRPLADLWASWSVSSFNQLCTSWAVDAGPLDPLL